MEVDKEVLLNEIRYSERLCQRTARLYRKIQTAGTAATVIAGSAALSALSTSVPGWVSLVGGAAFVTFGALLLAIRPADKAAANENDMKRYSKLRAEAGEMDAAALVVALNKTRESDAPEIEPLRDVAFNDMVREVGQDGHVVPLSLRQRVLAYMA